MEFNSGFKGLKHCLSVKTRAKRQKMMKDEDLKEKISLWNTTECSRAYQKWVVSVRCSVFSHSIPL